mmetsp:Transcript_27287/g.70779  ORF Transcript_27287/g.70779 Transcript_27287/m.70779 type:complete len:431 (-) Transcript_27287:75-1367(-)
MPDLSLEDSCNKIREMNLIGEREPWRCNAFRCDHTWRRALGYHCLHRGVQIAVLENIRVLGNVRLQRLRRDDTACEVPHGQKRICYIVDIAADQCLRHETKDPLTKVLGSAPAQNRVQQLGLSVVPDHGCQPVLQPGMLKGFGCRESCFAVTIQQPRDETACFFVDRPPKTQAIMTDSMDNCLIVPLAAAGFPFEGRATNDEDVHNHTKAPHVAFVGVRSSQQIRGRVQQGPARQIHLLARLRDFREPEVDKLQFGIGIATGVQPILQFQVPVHHIVSVQIGDRMQHLQCSFLRFLFCESLPAAVDQPSVQLTPGAMLHDQTQSRAVFIHQHQTADMRMIDLQVHFRLIAHHLNTVGPCILFCELLQSKPLARRAMLHQPHRPRVSLSQLMLLAGTDLKIPIQGAVQDLARCSDVVGSRVGHDVIIVVES